MKKKIIFSILLCIARVFFCDGGIIENDIEVEWNRDTQLYVHPPVKHLLLGQIAQNFGFKGLGIEHKIKMFMCLLIEKDRMRERYKELQRTKRKPEPFTRDFNHGYVLEDFNHGMRWFFDHDGMCRFKGIAVLISANGQLGPPSPIKDAPLRRKSGPISNADDMEDVD